VKFLVHFDDRLYWNRFLGPPIKAIRKQAEALPSEQNEEMSNDKKHSTQFQTRNKAKRDPDNWDIGEVCESQKKRTKLTNAKPRTSPKKSPGNKKLPSTLFMYPFPFEVKEEKLQEISSELTELGGYGFTDPEPTAGSETNSRDETESKEECVAANLDSSIISSRKHYVKIDEDDRKRLEPGRYCNDSIVDFWMSWYVFFSFFFSQSFTTERST
jgi:Ulp1 family protease